MPTIQRWLSTKKDFWVIAQWSFSCWEFKGKKDNVSAFVLYWLDKLLHSYFFLQARGSTWIIWAVWSSQGHLLATRLLFRVGILLKIVLFLCMHLVCMHVSVCLTVVIFKLIFSPFISYACSLHIYENIF